MRVSTVEGRGEGREVRRGGLGEGVSEQSSQRGCEPEPSACEEGESVLQLTSIIILKALSHRFCMYT